MYGRKRHEVIDMANMYRVSDIKKFIKKLKLKDNDIVCFRCGSVEGRMDCEHDELQPESSCACDWDE